MMDYHFTLNKVASALRASEHELNRTKAFLQLHEAIQVYTDTGVSPKQINALKIKHDASLAELGGSGCLPALVRAFEETEIEKKERTGWQKLIGSGTVVEGSMQAEKLWNDGRFQDAIYLLRRSILQHRDVILGGGSSKLKGMLIEYSFQYAERLFKEHDQLLSHITTTKQLRREQLQEVEEGLVMAYKLNPSSQDIKRRLKNFLELWEVYDEYEEACKQLEMRNVNDAKQHLKSLPMEYEFVRERFEECDLLEAEVDDLYRQGEAAVAERNFKNADDIVTLIKSKHACFERLPAFESSLAILSAADGHYQTARNMYQQHNIDEASNEMGVAIELDSNYQPYRDFQNELLNKRAEIAYLNATGYEQLTDLENAIPAYQKVVDILPHYADATDKLNVLSVIRAGLEKAMIEAGELFSSGSLEEGLNLLKEAQQQGFSLAYVDKLLLEYTKRLTQAQQIRSGAEVQQQSGNFAQAASEYHQAFALYSGMSGLSEAMDFCESEAHLQQLKEQADIYHHSGQLEQLFALLIGDPDFFSPAADVELSPAYQQICKCQLSDEINTDSKFYTHLKQMFEQSKMELQAFSKAYQEAYVDYSQQQLKDKLQDENAMECYQAIASTLKQTSLYHYPDSPLLSVFLDRIQTHVVAEEAYQTVVDLLGPECLVHQVLPELLEKLSLLTSSFPDNEKYQRLMKKVVQVFPLFSEMKQCIVEIRDYHFKQASYQLRMFKRRHVDASDAYQMMENEFQRFLRTDLQGRIAQSKQDKKPSALIADLQLAQDHLHPFPDDFQIAMTTLQEQEEEARQLYAHAVQAMQQGDFPQCETLLNGSLCINKELNEALSLQQDLPQLKQGYKLLQEGKKLLNKNQFTEALDQFDQANALNDSLPEIQSYYRQAEEGQQTEKVESMIAAAENMFVRERYERAQQYAEEALSLLPATTLPSSKRWEIEQLIAKVGQKFSINGNMLLLGSNGRQWRVLLDKKLILGREGSAGADIPLGLQTISSAGKQTALLHENRAVYVLDQGSSNGSLLKKSAERCPQGQQVVLNDQDSLIVGQAAELKLNRLKGDDAWRLHVLKPDHLDASQLGTYWSSLKKDMNCEYLLMGRECYFGMNEHGELMPVGYADDDHDLLLKIQYSEQKGYRAKLLERDDQNVDQREGWQPLRDGDVLLMRDIKLFVEQL